MDAEKGTTSFFRSKTFGANIIRGLRGRGYSDEQIAKIAGGNALDFFRRVMS
jgi:microsomal dipeptidase-like Zn-dependent dipeptidase